MPIRPLPLVLALAATSFAWPVAADCQPAGPIEQALPAAPVAFVGTVTALNGPIATFAVGEVWAGDVPDVVEVRGLSDDVGGPDAGFGAGFSEDDRVWTQGATYLVVPFLDGAVMRDSACTATTEWRPGLDALRPDDARIVSSAATDGTAPPVEVLLVGAFVLLVAGASVLAFRRR